MNDITYMEAARHLARRMIDASDDSVEARLVHGFRLITSRSPKDIELRRLKRSVEKSLNTFTANPDQVEAFLSVGESTDEHTENRPEWAAYTMVASTILNLDETVTRE